MSWYLISLKKEHPNHSSNTFWLAVENDVDLDNILKQQGLTKKDVKIKKQKSSPFDEKKPVIDKESNLDGMQGLSSQVFDENPTKMGVEETKKTVKEIMDLRDQANDIVESTDEPETTKIEGDENAKG